MSEQRWLSLDGICDTLGITCSHALWLARKGILAYIPSNMGNKNVRFLDPTPEYAQKLILAEAIYGRLFPIPKDLELAGLLTSREISVIMGWTIEYTKIYLWRNKVPFISVGRRKGNRDGGAVHKLYSVRTIRDILWKRQGRKEAAKGRNRVFLLKELLAFFGKYQTAENEEVPTDEMFREDDLLMRKLTRLLRSKDPKALRDFYDKLAVAKEVVKRLSA